MLMENFLSTNIFLISVTIQKIQKFFHPTKKIVIGKMKEMFEEKAIVEFVGLKSKMYPMETIDGKETNTAKAVNIATEFNEFNKALTRK